MFRIKGCDAELFMWVMRGVMCLSVCMLNYRKFVSVCKSIPRKRNPRVFRYIDESLKATNFQRITKIKRSLPGRQDSWEYWFFFFNIYYYFYFKGGWMVSRSRYVSFSSLLENLCGLGVAG